MVWVHCLMILTRRHFQIQAAASLLGLGAAQAQAQNQPQSLHPRPLTPRLTQGPFRPILWPRDTDADLTQIRGRRERALGTVIEIQGRVLSPNGRPLGRVEINLWQANAAGRYRHPFDRVDRPLDPNFDGAARLVTDDQGQWRIRTVMPGAYPVGEDLRAPHIHVEVINGRVKTTTQMLFAGQALNDRDPLLRGFQAGGSQALQPLLARRTPSGAEGLVRYGWDLIVA